MKNICSVPKEQTFIITGSLLIGILAGAANHLFVNSYENLYGFAVEPFADRGVVLLAPIAAGAVLLIGISKIPFAPPTCSVSDFRDSLKESIWEAVSSGEKRRACVLLLPS